MVGETHAIHCKQHLCKGCTSVVDAQRRSLEIAAHVQALCFALASTPGAAVVLSALLLGRVRGARIVDCGEHPFIFVFPRRLAH